MPAHVLGPEERFRHETLNADQRGTVTLLPDPPQQDIWCPIISVDDHALEPPDLFVGRVPARLEERAPFVEENEEGVPYWRIGDTRQAITMTNGSVGRPQSEWTHAPTRYDEVRLGVWDPRARLTDMDLDGIYAALNFPSLVFGFAGRAFSHMADPEAGFACFRAWNLWMLEEWCGADPLRYIPCQMPWLRDIERATREIRLNADAGFKGVTFPENPEPLGFPSLYSGEWDPFFAACEETGTVINLHVGSSGILNSPSLDSPREAMIALFPVSGIYAAVDWVFSKVPVRFPDLRIVLSEAGASWVPMVIERFHRAYRQLGSPMEWTAQDGDPADVFRRNFRFASLEDPAAFRLLDVIGEDNLMVETDYPHPDSVWPKGQSLIRSETESLGPSTIGKVCFGNAACLFRHPPPPPERVAASIVGIAALS